MKTTLKTLACLLALTALALPMAAHAEQPAQPAQPKPPNQMDMPSEGEGLAIPQVDASHPTLARAAMTVPIDPEQIKALVPTRLAGLERKMLQGNLAQFGPASMTTVTATFADGTGKILELKIIDPAGLPADQLAFLPMIPVGTTQDTDKSKLEGKLVDGHPGVLEVGERVMPKLEVGVGSRLRVSLRGRGVEASQLTDIATGLPLSGLSELLP